jgi:hypothetical protein
MLPRCYKNAFIGGNIRFYIGVDGLKFSANIESNPASE